jgi:hypothetical protein
MNLTVDFPGMGALSVLIATFTPRLAQAAAQAPVGMMTRQYVDSARRSWDGSTLRPVSGHKRFSPSVRM